MDLLHVTTPDGTPVESSTVITVVCLMFLYTFVGICAGFGGGLTTMPLVSLLLPVKMAAPMAVIVGSATALYATWLSRKDTDWKSAVVLIIFSMMGIPIGLYALSYLPDTIMKMTLGVFLIVYSFYSLFIPRLPTYDKRWIAAPMGAIAGAMGAAFATNGPPLVIYGMLRNLAPAAFRGTLNAVFTANNLMIIGGQFSTGIANMSSLKLVILSIPMMILGSLVGQFVHKRLPPPVFRKLVFYLLIGSGAMLIKGAAQLPALPVLGIAFGTLIVLTLIFGRKVAAIRAEQERIAAAEKAVA
ncbi:sulfite exporter TauE/SafE family protein [Variovorax humicola]|uniref:Probable membrane transporter protein n=1 Tax=Variovorax humicola TaxID=1769758 RepID=A0ABU8W397_9BURK